MWIIFRTKAKSNAKRRIFEMTICCNEQRGKSVDTQHFHYATYCPKQFFFSSFYCNFLASMCTCTAHTEKKKERGREIEHWSVNKIQSSWKNFRLYRIKLQLLRCMWFLNQLNFKCTPILFASHHWMKKSFFRRKSQLCCKAHLFSQCGLICKSDHSLFSIINSVHNDGWFIWNDWMKQFSSDFLKFKWFSIANSFHFLKLFECTSLLKRD